MLLVNVYEGLGSIPRGSIRQLRLIGRAPQAHPVANNTEHAGRHERRPGKFVLGTVPWKRTARPISACRPA